MNARELAGYRQHLLALAARLKGDVSGLTDEALRRSGGEASGNLSNAPLHLADLGTDNFDQEVAISLLENERQVLGEIAAALDRLEGGTFGHCARCGGEIPRGRLEALPYATHCLGCARRAEREQAGFARLG
jgi:RNA polymerase-binding transcription factor DksA